MKKTYLQFVLCFVCLIITTVSCKKDKDPAPPTITLISGAEYTATGDTVAIGGKLRFGITASGPDANITNLVVKKVMPDGSIKVVLDSGLNSTGFSINETFYQSIEAEARWTFQVMDKNRQFATTAITVYKDPASAWGGIYDYPSIVMGFQNSTAHGQFLVPSTGKVYFADTAALNQNLIDIITYYYVDVDPSPTFSSAGETGEIGRAHV